MITWKTIREFAENLAKEELFAQGGTLTEKEINQARQEFDKFWAEADKKHSDKKFWLIWRDDECYSWVEHSLKEAQEKAKELSKELPQYQFYILEAVHAYGTTFEQWEVEL